MARLVPIYKKEPRDLTENYRPIPILPAISKIMERLLYDQIYQYLKSHSILLRLYLIVQTVGILIWTVKCLI